MTIMKELDNPIEKKLFFSISEKDVLNLSLLKIPMKDDQELILKNLLVICFMGR